MTIITTSVLLGAAIFSTSGLMAQTKNAGCNGPNVAGLWQLNITPDHAPPGTVIVAVVLFGRDGTFTGQGGTLGPPPPAQTLGNQTGQAVGQWEQVSAREFQLVAYNPILMNGAVNGFQRVRVRIILSETGNQFTSTGDQGDWLDLKGNVVFSDTSHSVATRLESPRGCPQDQQ